MNQFPTLLILMILSFHHLIQTTIKPITAMRQPSISQPPVNIYRSNQSLSYSLQHRQSIYVCTLRAHTDLFSPALSTVQKSLELNYIHHFPGITSETLKKYPPQSSAMIKGRIDQSIKNQRSTKKNSKNSTSQLVYEPVSNSSHIDDSFFPPSDPDNN